MESEPIQIPPHRFEVKTQNSKHSRFVTAHSYDELVHAAKEILNIPSDTEVRLMEPFKVILRPADFHKLVHKQVVVILRKGEKINCKCCVELF